jgi:hypothetical protein
MNTNDVKKMMLAQATRLVHEILTGADRMPPLATAPTTKRFLQHDLSLDAIRASQVFAAYRRAVGTLATM